MTLKTSLSILINDLNWIIEIIVLIVWLVFNFFIFVYLTRVLNSFDFWSFHLLSKLFILSTVFAEVASSCNVEKFKNRSISTRVLVYEIESLFTKLISYFSRFHLFLLNFKLSFWILQTSINFNSNSQDSLFLILYLQERH